MPICRLPKPHRLHSYGGLSKMRNRVPGGFPNDILLLVFVARCQMTIRRRTTSTIGRRRRLQRTPTAETVFSSFIRSFVISFWDIGFLKLVLPDPKLAFRTPRRAARQVHHCNALPSSLPSPSPLACPDRCSGHAAPPPRWERP